MLADAILDEDLEGYGPRRDERFAAGFGGHRPVRRVAAADARQELFAVLRGDQELTDRFFGTFAGTVAPEALFSAAGR